MKSYINNNISALLLLLFNNISVILGVNPYKHLLTSIKIGQKECQYYDIGNFGTKYGKINFLFITLQCFICI